jgi:hypothetical protein
MTSREHKTGEAQSCVDSIHNLELGEEDNLAEVAQAKVLTEVTYNDPDNPLMDNQEVVTNTCENHCEDHCLSVGEGHHQCPKDADNQVF